MSNKKYFATKVEQNEAVNELFEEFGDDPEQAEVEKKFIEEGLGARDSDGDFLFFDTLEEMKLEQPEKLEIWEDDSECVTERLMSAAVEMYQGPWDESEIIALVLEAIAKKHLGGVQ